MSHVSDKPATGLLEDLALYTRIYRQMLLPGRIAAEIRERLR